MKYPRHAQDEGQAEDTAPERRLPAVPDRHIRRRGRPERPRRSKFRLHLFEPPDVSRPPAAGVAHADPPERLYQAAFEIAFPLGIEMESCSSPRRPIAACRQGPGPVRQAAHPVSRAELATPSSTTVRMTLAGRRGSRTAACITSIGATNQLRDDIARLVLEGPRTECHHRARCQCPTRTPSWTTTIFKTA